MLDIVSKVFTNVLTALYQPFWFAVLLAILFMFTWMYAGEHGWKMSIRIWISKFKTSTYFRKMFLLVFYTAMILFQTLLNRNMWMNPLSKVMDGWWIYEDGELTTECIENVMLFIPFTWLLVWVISSNTKMREKMFERGMNLNTIICLAIKITFFFSVIIEFLQLFLRLGTFQVSDIVYNTLGGFLGGLIYWIGWKVKHRESSWR